MSIKKPSYYTTFHLNAWNYSDFRNSRLWKQNLPVVPSGQLQTNPPPFKKSSVHMPPRHGLLSHAFTLISHLEPVNPFGHAHVKLLVPTSWQNFPTPHGDEVHGNGTTGAAVVPGVGGAMVITGIRQDVPVYWAGHTHLNELSNWFGTQVPLLKHRLYVQGSARWSHLWPVQPRLHEHWKSQPRATQVAPFRHSSPREEQMLS